MGFRAGRRSGGFRSRVRASFGNDQYQSQASIRTICSMFSGLSSNGVSSLGADPVPVANDLRYAGSVWGRCDALGQTAQSGQLTNSTMTVAVPGTCRASPA